MNSYKGVIFDLDGTLSDTMGIWEYVDVIFLGNRGVQLPDDYMQAIAFLGARATAEYTIKRFNFSDTPEELISEWVELANEQYKLANFKPGAETYLNYLADNNISISIATATDRRLVETFLEARGVINKIDHIVTLSDVKRGKEFPDIYLECCKRMNLNPWDCIVCEDILTAVKSAKSGGFYVVGMHDKYSEKDAAEIKNTCHKFIYDFSELINQNTGAN